MEQTRLAVVIGSVRPGRFGPTVATWFTRHAKRRDELTVDLVDIADGPLPAARIAAADAVVLVTPEYNHSFPGPLKTAIDGLRDEWCATPVGFVSYGARSGGLRAVEALRLVFAELHTVTARAAVSFHDVSDWTGESPPEPDEASAAADELIDQLLWWTAAVRAAPAYPGTAVRG